ncbi:Inositol polyphosphate kinase, partial [Amanita muscaria]
VKYYEDAPLEKKQRMMETARKTSSFETGVRLTGFQVRQSLNFMTLSNDDNVTNQPILTPKSYGKSIDKSQLPDGIARFLPVGGSKDEEASPCGLPVSLLLPIMQGIKEDIQEIRDVVASLEVRIVGGSLLVIYEADWERAEKGLKWLEEQDDEDEMEDDDEESEDEERGGPPYVVKLIDFAHTRLVPGKGPDQSVLTGIDTMIRLIDGRIKELTP